ncbi:MAG: hypothetical protein ABI821_16185 [Pseudomonadota bacterium]
MQRSGLTTNQLVARPRSLVFGEKAANPLSDVADTEFGGGDAAEFDDFIAYQP